MGFIQATTRGGGGRSLVANDETIKKFNFLDLLENSEIKRQPIGTVKRNSNSGKKLERGCQLPRTDAKEG
jgi:hypothetical protein